MERIIPKIKEIAERISSDEEKRRLLAEALKKSKVHEISQRIEPDPLNDVKVVGVDGGIVKKSLHGFDCMLARAAGVCFHYKDGKIAKVDYLPSRVPTPKPDVVEALSDLDWSLFTSISRQREEIRMAMDCIDKFEPDMLLMDGSIVPHYTDRPSKSSEMYENYRKLIEDCKSLYNKAMKSNVALLGVIEDSRGDSFCKMMKDEMIQDMKSDGISSDEMERIIQKTRDTNLLFWVLEKGEKSKTFPYSSKPEEHPVLRDLEELGSHVFSFYLKTAKFDRPIRVDFLRQREKESEEDCLASVLLAISGQHPEYGLPAPLIEADNVAKMSEDEINNFYSHILSFTSNSPGLMRLRRDQRPF